MDATPPTRQCRRRRSPAAVQTAPSSNATGRSQFAPQVGSSGSCSPRAIMRSAVQRPLTHSERPLSSSTNQSDRFRRGLQPCSRASPPAPARPSVAAARRAIGSLGWSRADVSSSMTTDCKGHFCRTSLSLFSRWGLCCLERDKPPPQTMGTKGLRHRTGVEGEIIASWALSHTSHWLWRFTASSPPVPQTRRTSLMRTSLPARHKRQLTRLPLLRA